MLEEGPLLATGVCMSMCVCACVGGSAGKGVSVHLDVMLRM